MERREKLINWEKSGELEANAQLPTLGCRIFS